MNIHEVISIAALICAVLTFLDVRSAHKNRKLRRQLRAALADVRAFYEIETRLCESIAHSSNPPENPVTIRRMVRKAIREDGMPSPSEDATPHRIAQIMVKL